MSTFTRVALLIGACVAALLSTSCSAESPSSSDPNGRPPFTAQEPEGFDRWDEMNSGETLQEMAALAPTFGIDAINIPKKEYLDQGLVGVALLEKYCVLALEDASTKGGKTLLHMTMMSRFNASYVVAMPSLPPANVPEMIEKYRDVCKGEADFPTGQVEQTQTA